MSWIKWPDTDARGRRFNDLAHVGGTWWAVATTGVVWRWRDGQAPQPCDHMQGQMRAIAIAPGGQVGWIGRLRDGAFGPLAMTLNGGGSWTEVTDLPAETPHAICALAAVSEHDAWALGAYYLKDRPSALLHFDGERWQNVPLPGGPPAALTDLWFFDAVAGAARRGVVAGGRLTSGGALVPVIYFTTDSGASWQEATLPPGVPQGRYCWKLHFNDDNLGFASLEALMGNGDAAILKTVNGGRDWDLVFIVDPTMIAGPVLSNLQGIAFAPWDADMGWVGPRTKGLLTTWDGGAHWFEMREPREVNRILVVGDRLVAAGDALYWYERAAKIPE